MEAVRLDAWLWAARFFKTRGLAKQAVDGGHVELNGAGAKPAKLLRAGDRLRIRRGEESFEVTVLAAADRRGPASVAATLYAESAASRAAREAARGERRMVGRAAPEKRPDKQSRRLLRDLKRNE